jgi:quercetin dioxygenase-like cupin family protein
MSQTATIPALFYSAVQEVAVFDDDGPRPQFLVDSQKLKVIIAGLEPGQQIPPHPETLAVYHFLAGDGVMIVNDEEFVVTAGSTVVTPPGAARGMRATSRLTFLAAKSGEG